MSQSEFESWLEFYRTNPFDDYHRFYRPAALISVGVSGGDIQSKLDWLQPKPGEADMTDADARTLKAFGLRK